MYLMKRQLEVAYQVFLDDSYTHYSPMPTKTVIRSSSATTLDGSSNVFCGVTGAEGITEG